MEDTRSLLIMVLQKVFENQPKTIENTFQLIHNFNNGKIDKTNYEKTLKTICDLMNDQLPSPILVYILTLVDMPHNLDSHSQIMEKMRKTHDFLPEINVRPHLLEFLNNMKSSSKTKKPDTSIEVPKRNIPRCSEFVKPARVKRTRKMLLKSTGPVKNLLDLCANYVVKNEAFLKEMYRSQQRQTWTIINNSRSSERTLKACYNLLNDLNKKIKWLREIESDNISLQMLMDEYKNTDVFSKITQGSADNNPPELSQECEVLIDKVFGVEN